MNKFERKFIVSPGGKVEERKLTESEEKKLNKPKTTDMLSMTAGGSLVRKGRDGKVKEVLVEGEKEQLG